MTLQEYVSELIEYTAEAELIASTFIGRPYTEDVLIKLHCMLADHKKRYDQQGWKFPMIHGSIDRDDPRTIKLLVYQGPGT